MPAHQQFHDGRHELCRDPVVTVSIDEGGRRHTRLTRDALPRGAIDRRGIGYYCRLAATESTGGKGVIECERKRIHGLRCCRVACLR